MGSSENHWQFTKGKLTERGKYIFENRLWTDCNFIVGTLIVKEFPAHSLILSMASPIFERMFRGELMEKDINGIEIPDVQPEAFCTMLNYIYSDNVELKSFAHACDVYYAANKYMLQNLLDLCLAYVTDNLNNSNACKGYEFADLFDLISLQSDCKEIICNKAAMVLVHKSFLDVQMSTVIMMLNSEKLNAPEVLLFNAIERWTEAEFSRRGIHGEKYLKEQQEIYSELLPLFSFLSMSPKDFAEGPSKSHMLPLHESLSILCSLTSTDCSKQYPTGLSTKLRGGDSDKYVSLEWSLINEQSIEVNSNFVSFTFWCDTDINLTGIMVRTQPPDNKNGTDLSNFESNDEDKDDLNVYLYKHYEDDKILLASFSYNNLIYYHITKLFFNEPVKISKSKVYKIEVKLKNTACYSYSSIPSHTLTHNSRKFTINDLQSLLCGIIYIP